MNFQNSIILLLLIFSVTFSSCSEITSSNKTDKVNNKFKTENFFKFIPDSVNGPLEMAIDTLKKRENKEPFVQDFIQDKGEPVWEVSSTFTQDNNLVILVPTIDNNKTVTGLLNINIESKNPVFNWIERGKKAKRSKNLTKGAVEVFILGFEKRVFKKVKKEGIEVSITEQKSQIDIKSDTLNTLSRWEYVPVDQRCYRVDVGGLHGRNPEYTESYLDYYFGNWQCERIYDWVYFPDDRDGGGDDGRSGGGGSGNTDDDDDNNNCPTGQVEDVDGNCVPVEPDPEPCETNGEHPALDDQNVQDGMNSLWQKSLDTGVEQGAFVYPNSYGGYAFNPLADNLIIDEGYDFIEFGIPANAPDNMIFIHTHPTRETLNKNGITFKYQHHPSEEDYNAMNADKIIKGYILDPDMIIEFNSSEVTDTLDRCGY